MNQLDDCKMVKIKLVYNALYKHRNKISSQKSKKDPPIKNANNSDSIIDLFLTNFCTYDADIQQKIMEKLKEFTQADSTSLSQPQWKAEVRGLNPMTEETPKSSGVSRFECIRSSIKKSMMEKD